MSVAEPPSSPLIETDAGEAAGGRPDTTAEPEVVVQEVDRLATPDPVEGGGEVDGKTALSTGSRSPEEALEKEKEKEVDDDPIVVDGPPPVLIKCRIPGCDATVQAGPCRASRPSSAALCSTWPLRRSEPFRLLIPRRAPRHARQVMSGIAEASHMRQDHPDEYKIYYPKPRGRPLKRRRHLHLFMSQVLPRTPGVVLPFPISSADIARTPGCCRIAHRTSALRNIGGGLWADQQAVPSGGTAWPWHLFGPLLLCSGACRHQA